MKHITYIFLILCSCNALPQLYQATDDILTDDVIQIIVSREALTHQTDLTIVIDVNNKTD